MEPIAGWFVIALLGALLLAIPIIALFQIWGSGEPQNTKLLWTILVVVAPLIGAIIWWAVGKRAAEQTSPGL